MILKLIVNIQLYLLTLLSVSGCYCVSKTAFETEKSTKREKPLGKSTSTSDNKF